MKWNDIVHHMKKNSGTPSAPISITPTDVPQTPSAHFHVRKWIPAIVIFLIVIIGLATICVVIKNRNTAGSSRLSSRDAAYVDEFFKNNPPAQLTPTDMSDIQKFLTTDEFVAPPAKPITPKKK